MHQIERLMTELTKYDENCQLLMTKKCTLAYIGPLRVLSGPCSVRMTYAPPRQNSSLLAQRSSRRRFIRDAHFVVPGCEPMVSRMVRSCPAVVGDRTGEGCSPGVFTGVVIRDDLLFWDLLVADVCSDQLRGVSAGARVFLIVLRHCCVGHIPRYLCRHSGYRDPQVR